MRSISDDPKPVRHGEEIEGPARSRQTNTTLVVSLRHPVLNAIRFMHGVPDDAECDHHHVPAAVFKLCQSQVEGRSPIRFCTRAHLSRWQGDRIDIASIGRAGDGPSHDLTAICRHRTLPRARRLIPRFDGAILSLEWKDAVWDRFVMGAPRPRTPSEQQYSDRKLRSRR